MKALKLTLRPLTPFGTPLAGDTLFGHLCWALAWRHGSSALDQLLEGYTTGQPFAVVSDAFPAGFLPRPTVPDFIAGLAVDADGRKKLKQKKWLPAEHASQPLAEWLALEAAPPAEKRITVTQNTINRLTGTTGQGPFAPRQVEQSFAAPEAELEVYVLLDEQRIQASDARQALSDIGLSGFGRDASTGLGKFEVLAFEETEWARAHAPHAMTLAPCAFEPQALEPEGCWWQPVTRFGRHGSTAALAGGEGGAFKKPLMLARTGAVLRWRGGQGAAYHGRGLGGTRQALSSVMPSTVHQGYAPCIPISLGEPQPC